MTNQQGVPEALRPITRYEVVDCIDSKHVPAVIPNRAGPWVRYEDHVAALVEARQPAPSAAAAVNPDPHAELRKTWQPGQRWQARSFRNGQWGPWTDAVASEPFWFPHQDYRRHPDDLAPQPSPTPQADSVTATAGGGVAELVDTINLPSGATLKKEQYTFTSPDKLWALYRGKSLIRWLNSFECQFVDAALAAARKQGANHD